MRAPRKRNPRDNSVYRARIDRERRRLRRNPEAAVCWLCGEPVDMSLPYTHPRAFTLDHVVPIDRGGHVLGETRPAHRACNSSRGNAAEVKRGTTAIEW